MKRPAVAGSTAGLRNTLDYVYGIRNFAGLCPQCGGHHAPHTHDIENSLKDWTKKAQTAFEKAAKFLHKKGDWKPEYLEEKPIKALIETHYNAYKEGYEPRVQDNVIPDEMRQALAEQVYVFSGCKTETQLREATALLRDDNGKIKPFDTFKKDIQQIDEAYNVNYLKAEYQFAIASAMGVAKWKSYEADGDRYYLQYRTAQDDKVRDSHQALHNITLPIDDPFWDSFLPPNGWRCRCNATQVLKAKYEKSDSEAARKAGEKATTQLGKDGDNKLEMFRFNPGKQSVIFPPKHPYFAYQANAPKKP